LPLLAVSMVVVTTMVGLGIDTARLQLVQSKLQFSLDAAGLAGGSTVSTATMNTEVSKYLNANFNGYLGAILTGSSVTANSSNTVFTLTATAQLPSTFMGIVGITTLTANAHSQINRAVTGLELVMVLDNTGSMNDSAGGSQSKIQALQGAATTLINTLYGGSSTAPNNLWIGIVPFSQSVNIGTSYPTWMDTTYDSTLTDWGPGGSWAGCVDARWKNSSGVFSSSNANEDVTDDPPSQSNINTLFRQYYWTSDNLNTDGVSNSGANKWKIPVYQRCKGTNCSTVTSSCSTNGGYTCTLTGYNYTANEGPLTSGPNYLCPQQVTPMTNNKTTLLNAINSMVAQGDTLINLGLVWGWRMLSPRWQGLWGGTMNSNGLPLAYGTPGMNKAIVLLTDGENTVDNTAHSAYWFLGDNRLGSTNGTTAVNTLNTRTNNICTSMKNNGIYIYTIALGTDTTPTSLALLQNCATASNYYFNSPSTSTLQNIFSAIGDSLSNLRVSQ